MQTCATLLVNMVTGLLVWEDWQACINVLVFPCVSALSLTCLSTYPISNLLACSCIFMVACHVTLITFMHHIHSQVITAWGAYISVHLIMLLAIYLLAPNDFVQMCTTAP